MPTIEDKIRLNIGDLVFRLSETQLALEMCIAENDQLRLKLAKLEPPPAEVVPIRSVPPINNVPPQPRSESVEVPEGSTEQVG